MPILKYKITLIVSLVLSVPFAKAQSRPLLARPEISVLQADNIIVSYESYKRESDFINIQEDLHFESAVLTFSRRTSGGFEYAVSAGGARAAIEDYTASDGSEIDRMQSSHPGYIFSAEISRDIAGDLIIFPQWRVYLRGYTSFYSFDQADSMELEDSIDLQSSGAEIALLVSRQWYPVTLYGAFKFSYIQDCYKYTDSYMYDHEQQKYVPADEAVDRTSHSSTSIITPLVGIKYNLLERFSIRGEALLGLDFGESGFTAAVNYEF